MVGELSEAASLEIGTHEVPDEAYSVPFFTFVLRKRGMQTWELTCLGRVVMGLVRFGRLFAVAAVCTSGITTSPKVVMLRMRSYKMACPSRGLLLYNLPAKLIPNQGEGSEVYTSMLS